MEVTIWGHQDPTMECTLSWLDTGKPVVWVKLRDNAGSQVHVVSPALDVLDQWLHDLSEAVRRLRTAEEAYRGQAREGWPNEDATVVCSPAQGEGA